MQHINWTPLEDLASHLFTLFLEPSNTLKEVAYVYSAGPYGTGPGAHNLLSTDGEKIELHHETEEHINQLRELEPSIAKVFESINVGSTFALIVTGREAVFITHPSLSSIVWHPVLFVQGEDKTPDEKWAVLTLARKSPVDLMILKLY